MVSLSYLFLLSEGFVLRSLYWSGCRIPCPKGRSSSLDFKQVKISGRFSFSFGGEKIYKCDPLFFII